MFRNGTEKLLNSQLTVVSMFVKMVNRGVDPLYHGHGQWPPVARLDLLLVLHEHLREISRPLAKILIQWGSVRM